jgi:hypothetical protein
MRASEATGLANCSPRHAIVRLRDPIERTPHRRKLRSALGLPLPSICTVKLASHVDGEQSRQDMVEFVKKRLGHS